MPNENNNTGQSIRFLKAPECIRKRPAMYIGGTDPRGINQLVLELLDNTADQFLAGHATQIDVRIDQRLVQVSDDGAGLPFDKPHDASKSLAEHYLTSVHNKATADDHAPHVHFSGFGCGLCIVTALADHLQVDSWRNGQRWRQCFQEGKPLESARVIERGALRGTTYLYSPDPLVFGDTSFDLPALRRQCRITSHLLPGFRVTLQDETFHAPEGLANWCSELVGSRTSAPPMSVDCRVDDYRIQAAAIGVAAGETEWITFANGRETVAGGTHLTAFKRLLGYQSWRPAAALLHVTMMTPRFAGPTRERLDVPEIYTPMKQAIGPVVKDYCRQHRLGRHA